jgi:hypothetical protein
MFITAGFSALLVGSFLIPSFMRWWCWWWKERHENSIILIVVLFSSSGLFLLYFISVLWSITCSYLFLIFGSLFPFPSQFVRHVNCHVPTICRISMGLLENVNHVSLHIRDQCTGGWSLFWHLNNTRVYVYWKYFVSLRLLDVGTYIV